MSKKSKYLRNGICEEFATTLDDLAGASVNTVRAYTIFAKLFSNVVKKEIKDVTVSDVMQFLKWGENQGWKITTIRYYGGLSQRFLREFKDDRFMKDLKKKIAGLPRQRAHASLYEGVYIPGDRIDDFINAAPDEKHAIVYTMILKWGLRLNEVFNQRIEDINPKLLRVTVRGKGAGKEHKVRAVWVDRESLRKVLEFVGCSSAQINGKIALRRKGNVIRNIAPRTIQVNWKKTAKKIRLRNWKKLTPHDGRHSYAIDFLLKRKKQGMAALVLLKNQLGHTDINTTMIYLDIAGTEAREVFDAGFNDVAKEHHL